MKKNTMIAGSYPTIITSGGSPRVNKDMIDDIFLRKYVALLGELLKVKGNLEDINITYIGGYSNEDNISRAKLYISAFNYYLNDLGYASLSKGNVTVIDAENIEASTSALEQCDLLFLGIGSDQVFMNTLNKLEEKNLYLNAFIERKNLLVSSICSGSVLAAKQIYGGMYDSYYYGKEVIEYPLNMNSLNINPVTMETDFFPNDASEEKTFAFIENNLKPDSSKIVLFACKPNSLFMIEGEKTFAYGEIYLFMDGKYQNICRKNEKADVTKLVMLTEQYNKIKNRECIFNERFCLEIEKEVAKLIKEPLSSEFSEDELSIINQFSLKEKQKNMKREQNKNIWSENLKSQLNSLFSEENLQRFEENQELQARYKNLGMSVINRYNVDVTKDGLKELYLKIKLTSLIKMSYIQYKGYDSDFKKDMYDLLESLVGINPLLVYFVMDSCGSLFNNQQLKKLLKAIQIENVKRPQALINDTKSQLMLFRRERKYARG